MICVELMSKVQYAGFGLAEVPVHHFHRAYGKSQFFNWRRVVRTLSALWALWLRSAAAAACGAGGRGRRRYAASGQRQSRGRNRMAQGTETSIAASAC